MFLVVAIRKTRGSISQNSSNKSDEMPCVCVLCVCVCVGVCGCVSVCREVRKRSELTINCDTIPEGPYSVSDLIMTWYQT